MSQPSPTIPAATTDSVTAILLAVTRMEGNLAGALEALKRHDGQISTLQTGLQTVTVDHGNRLVALETARASDTSQQARVYTGRSVLWAAVGSCSAVVAILFMIMSAMGH